MNLFSRTLYFLFFVLLSLVFTQKVFPEALINSDSLVVGKSFPNITLRKIQHYRSKEVDTKRLQGKWLILDFWSRGCTVCVSRFPVMNRIQSKYGDRLQVFLVGLKDDHIQTMYEKFRRKDSLQLPIILDTALFKRFKIQIVPYIIVIDPNGITRAITSELTEDDITSFLQGKTPLLRTALNSEQKDVFDSGFDSDKPLFVDGNGGNDTAFIFRSVLGHWVAPMPFEGFDFPRIAINHIRVTGMRIQELYKIAYGDTITNVPFRKPNSYGKYWPETELDVKDSTFFQADYTRGKNLYCYEQTVPPQLATNRMMQENMKRDLANYFGYRVCTEKRIKPCWILIKQADSLKNFEHPRTGYIESGSDLYDGTLEDLIAAIWYHNQTNGLFFDETGLDKTLQIHLDVIMSDINELNKGLKKYGLELRLEERAVNVIIISDPQKDIG